MTPRFHLIVASVASILISSCTSTGISSDIEDTLYPPVLEGIRWGLIITDLDGKVLVEHNADERFLPASTTKLLTTAAGFHWLDELNQRGDALATKAYLKPSDIGGMSDLVVITRGDAELSNAPDCETRCLADFATEIVSAGVSSLNNIIIDERWFPRENWVVGWSWEDLQYHYGTAISASALDKNIAVLTLEPGATSGDPIKAYWSTAYAPFDLDVQAKTVDVEDARLGLERDPGSKFVRVFGTMDLNAPPRRLKLGIAEPGKVLGEQLKIRLAEQGVSVTGDVSVQQFPSSVGSNSNSDEHCTIDHDLSKTVIPNSIAAIGSPDWPSTMTTINKDSQNLYAEMVLRQVGKLCGDGSSISGLERVYELLNNADVNPNGYDVFDGSGMSVYNRISPRTLATLLTYSTTQDWGQAWRNTFPIGGVDGSLKNRFNGSELQGRIFAKTGTLKGTNALAGFYLSKENQLRAFVIFANERPLSTRTATNFMDEALIKLAKQY